MKFARPSPQSVPPSSSPDPHAGDPGETVEDVAAPSLQAMVDTAMAALANGEDASTLETASRVDVAAMAARAAENALGSAFKSLNPIQRRDLITAVVNRVFVSTKPGSEEARKPAQPATRTDQKPSRPVKAPGTEKRKAPRAVENAHPRVLPKLLEQIDFGTAAELSRDELTDQVSGVVTDILDEEKIQLNQREQQALLKLLLDEMLGLGPLEPLLEDEDISDILVNGHARVYVERFGKLELTDTVFRDDAHVMNVATRIVSQVGRRVDEANPLADARLADGSRVNIIIPPLAIDGPSISIRKFSKQKITLNDIEKSNGMNHAMVVLLQVAARSRLNILISGGTGSGKTTLLNALSQMIGHDERVVTIEDAAELDLLQPHVVRLETRPPSLEGEGLITMRDLVKNALRMRPDRIIIGEVREAEAVDMLQAMNTGHEGSMSTIHANRPREALTRLENMVSMAHFNLPAKAVRTQISEALDVIIQVRRMRDGVRRITDIVEVVGMEGDVVVTQSLFSFKYEGDDSSGSIRGQYEYSNARPYMMPKAEFFGLDRVLMEALR